MTNILEISNLHVALEEGNKPLLKGVDLTVPLGQVHAIMGPNGAGKSTLGNTLAGKPGYDVTEGTITFDGTNLLDMEADERARQGLFLAFQYPVELPGVNAATFLRATVNATRTARGEDELDALAFLKLCRTHMAKLGMKDDFLQRSVNTGFSGGEKKRFEVLQLALLEPKLAILDETDSGLDVDALRAVAEDVNAMRAPTRSFLVITHYQRLLEYIQPDVVHVLVGGRIVKSGGPELAKELEQQGFEGLGDAA
jgi:Fe-S cluster assembly ATP-binding protein